MFGIINYSVFIISGIVLNLTPGADTIYILGNSISNGKKVGIMSALGISTGCIVHTIMAALGLSVILAKSAMAFNIIKYLGAAYLIYLGIRFLISKSSLVVQKDSNSSSLIKIYFQGVITNVLNPKVALFFLAFLPQFIHPNNSYGVIPFLILGFTFITTATLWSIVLVIFSSYIAGRLSEKMGLATSLNKITGAVFIALGLNLLRAKLGEM
ncbi:threonine/homoserine/homoserine lactone efflux protein [Clostridium tetanomorphum]|uniref:LysE family translocator n=1 Tax=Clostridium tetanomorphum TaxID=1553 RepID=A0A923E7I5_CLOTT|nr:LysE family translocator [Clostridium tetanomorphum]KAJ51271.1 homoserine/homoserine lactone efflux protein [Clostridium tetanomorphum DSM 665]MBC2397858.1 LysE family translocator [Clostridium tetanomorphum]MBP1864829.1 threonine/homoserine/homoserine lactone efflux protein [Clostridium tetanomorphum]NRS84005.1 threonine/homoserine/homoserine lactone efflux protein [Clostridium tetanomorphum]NRZ97222.1 threonine/homoserine/homoserine lactone efflux protein [Clostridium tetanomorphum]